ncbi:MAG TPA: peptide chain release factor N(5)-glutamine methyltransferase [Pirellulales bacterium]|nr:peptide chain release factor N(5)-glutamine methyltransferase [Pirellulales bacterium]
MPEQWTIGRLLAWTTDYLKRQGAESPRLDAEILLAAACGCQRIDLYTAFDEPADDAVREKFREWVRRRAEGTPVAYLVGHKEFYSLSFRVSPDVLIPRPETELLVVRLLDLAKERGLERGAIAIADIGTGSGIIAVSVAKHLRTAHVAAIDLSPQALTVARENAAAHGVADRIEWFQGDLFAAVPPGRQFDFIASNPPYVSSAEFAKLPPTVKDFEPHLALEAGPRGTEVIERLVPEAANRLKLAGSLLLEISPMIELAVREILGQQPTLEAGPTIKDLAGLPRVVQASKRA